MNYTHMNVHTHELPKTYRAVSIITMLLDSNVSAVKNIIKLRENICINTQLYLITITSLITPKTGKFLNSYADKFVETQKNVNIK